MKSGYWTTTLIVLVVTCLAGPGWSDEILQLQKQCRELKQDLQTLDLIFALQLRHPQLKAILAIAQKARPFYQQAEQFYQHFLPQYEQVLEQFLEEDQIGNGFTPAVEHRTARMHHREIMLKKQFCEGVNRFEKQVWPILTPQQQRLVQHYRPRALSRRRHRRRRQGGSRHDMLVSHLRRIRSMPVANYQARKEAIAERIIRQYVNVRGRRQGVPFNMQQEKQRLITNMDRLRSMSSQEFEAQKDQLIQNLMPGQDFRQTRAELQKIKAHKYGQIGNIGKYLITPRAIPILKALLKRASNL